MPAKPELDNADEIEYEVEEILYQKQVDDGTFRWLVKWKTYPYEDCRWEPEENLQNSKELLGKWDSQLETGDVISLKELRNIEELMGLIPERILDDRKTSYGKVRYFVKWENYGVEESSWEAEEDLGDSLVLRLWQTQPKQRKRPSKRELAEIRKKIDAFKHNNELLIRGFTQTQEFDVEASDSETNLSNYETDARNEKTRSANPDEHVAKRLKSGRRHRVSSVENSDFSSCQRLRARGKRSKVIKGSRSAKFRMRNVNHPSMRANPLRRDTQSSDAARASQYENSHSFTASGNTTIRNHVRNTKLEPNPVRSSPELTLFQNKLNDEPKMAHELNREPSRSGGIRLRSLAQTDERLSSRGRNLFNEPEVSVLQFDHAEKGHRSTMEFESAKTSSIRRQTMLELDRVPEEHFQSASVEYHTPGNAYGFVNMKESQKSALSSSLDGLNLSPCDPDMPLSNTESDDQIFSIGGEVSDNTSLTSSVNPPSIQVEQALGQRNENCQQNTETVARERYSQLYPFGHSIIPTSGANLKCGFRAAINTLDRMARDGYDVPVPTLRELDLVFEALEVQELLRTYRTAIDEEHYANYYVDQIAAVVKWWADTYHDCPLRLGWVVQDQPFLVPWEEDIGQKDPIIFFIHNNATNMIDEDTIYHFSGLAPISHPSVKIPEELATDQSQQSTICQHILARISGTETGIDHTDKTTSMTQMNTVAHVNRLLVPVRTPFPGFKPSVAELCLRRKNQPATNDNAVAIFVAYKEVEASRIAELKLWLVESGGGNVSVYDNTDASTFRKFTGQLRSKICVILFDRYYSITALRPLSRLLYKYENLLCWQAKTELRAEARDHFQFQHLFPFGVALTASEDCFLSEPEKILEILTWFKNFIRDNDSRLALMIPPRISSLLYDQAYVAKDHCTKRTLQGLATLLDDLKAMEFIWSFPDSPSYHTNAALRKLTIEEPGWENVYGSVLQYDDLSITEQKRKVELRTQQLFAHFASWTLRHTTEYRHFLAFTSDHRRPDGLEPVRVMFPEAFLQGMPSTLLHA